MASLPCSSSSSSSSNLLLKKEKLVVVMEPYDDDQNGGYCTPSSPESRIPAVVHCPPAPKKPKMCRRRAAMAMHFYDGQRFDFYEGLGLVLFEEVRCRRRRRRQRVRGRLAIASSTEIDENWASPGFEYDGEVGETTQ